jgi:serine/threonine protein kinase
VHRDVKPANVLRDQDGRIRLVDFGGARDIAATAARRASTVVGTFGYMAPEQLRGKALPASDLHALGATIVFILTGRSPAELPQRRLRVDLRGEARVPPALRPWLEKMLAPAIEDRFATARAAFAALARPRRTRVPRWVAQLLGCGVAACALLAALARADEPVAGFELPRTSAPRAHLVLEPREEVHDPPLQTFAVPLSLPGQRPMFAPTRWALGYAPSRTPIDRPDDAAPAPERLYQQLDNAEVEQIVDSVWKGEPTERELLIARIARPMAIRHYSREQIRAALVAHLHAIGAHRVGS